MATKSKFKADPAVATQKRADAMQLLERGVSELLDSENWVKYLKFQRGFCDYSATNALLIYMQFPTATRVAGFNTWLKKGRSVRKGEKGITILAPMPYTKVKTDDEGNEEQFSGISFKCVSVFDITQTDGDPIPTVTQPLLGDDNGLFDRMASFATRLNIPVSLESLECNGYCRFLNNKPIKIAIDSNLSRLHQAKTLVHELSHALLHGELDYSKHRPECELEAESTAFVVLDYFGIDSSAYSFGYLASWQGDKAKIQLKKSCDAIHKAASQIIEAIEC